jgi:CO dehydrogenase maturation factor
MKLAVAGKGGVGKTTIAAWLGDHLARQGRDVWLVDADTALSLGAALGLPPSAVPTPLIDDAELIRSRVGQGMISLTPEVADLPERLRVRVAGANLVVMGSVAGAGGGCACEANALLKALVAHLVLERDQWLVVDLEAGVEHLGRGTVAGVDGLVVVSEPSLRALSVAARVAEMAAGLGLTRQVLVLNRAPSGTDSPAAAAPLTALPDVPGLPPLAAVIPPLPGLVERQLTRASVLGLPERPVIDAAMDAILSALRHAAPGNPQPAR